MQPADVHALLLSRPQVVNNVTGFDRLIVLGGDNWATNNVYYSDDCGVTWYCYDGDQQWSARAFAAFFNIPGLTATYMGGGYMPGSFSVSRRMFAVLVCARAHGMSIANGGSNAARRAAAHSKLLRRPRPRRLSRLAPS